MTSPAVPASMRERLRELIDYAAAARRQRERLAALRPAEYVGLAADLARAFERRLSPE